MKEKNISADDTDKKNSQPHQVRIPGFVSDKEIGLGDVIKRTTSYMGIQPCGACERRASALNRWLVFTGSGNK